MNNRRTWFGIKERKWLLFLMLSVFGTLTAFFLLKPDAPLRNKPPVSASAPKKNDVSCLGRLLPGGRILQVAAPPGTVIDELLVQRGQWVEQGQILARLRDYARQAAALLQAEKEVAVAASELNRVRAGEKASTIDAQQSAIARQEVILHQEESHYERSRKLYERQVISVREFEDAQARRDTARQTMLWERRHLDALRDVRKEDVALAANKVGAAESSRKVARESVELNLIRAPVSGRVLEVYAFPGEAVPQRGLLELGSGKDMLVEAEVYVNDIGRVRIGAPAIISGDAFSGSLKGQVIEIVSMVTRSDVIPADPLAFSDLRVVKVWIRLEDSKPVAALGNHQVSVTIKPR